MRENRKFFEKNAEFARNLKNFFFFGISYSMGYLPNGKELQGMNDIEEGQEVDNQVVVV